MISSGKAVHCFIICTFNNFKVSVASSHLHRFNFPVEFHCDCRSFLECPINQIMIWFRCAGHKLRIIVFRNLLPYFELIAIPCTSRRIIASVVNPAGIAGNIIERLIGRE